MAIAFVESTSHTATTGSVISFSHTVTAGSNNVLILAVMWSSDSTSVTGVTYNSVSMTSSVDSGSGAGSTRSQLFYLGNPSTGSNTVEVTFSGTPIREAFVASTFSGVDQASTIGGTDSDISTNTPSSIDVPVAGSAGMVVDAFAAESTCTWAEAGAQTLMDGGQFESALNWGSSYRTHSGSTTNMGWTRTGACGAPVATPAGISLTQFVSTAHTSTVTDSISTSETTVAQLDLSVAITETLTMIETIVTDEEILWTNQTKPSTSWTNQSKF